MKNGFILLGMLLMTLTMQSLVVRHDVDDQQFIDLAKEYPQVAQPAFGESTLISEKYFLTAAHVAKYIKEDIDNGILHQVVCNGKEYQIDSVILHPDFEMTRHSIDHDMAILKIEGEINDVKPAKLYTTQDEVGKHIVIVGSGYKGNGLSGPEKSDKIIRAATNIVDDVRDQWLFFDFDNPDSEDATAYEGVSGQGDSGGPAFVDIDGQPYIIGVSSHQRNNTNGQGLYGVVEYYARVSLYLDWINEVICADN